MIKATRYLSSSHRAPCLSGACGDIFYHHGKKFDPSEGRFLSEDPIGFRAGDINLYRYVGSEPIKKSDPTGKIVGQGPACDLLSIVCSKESLKDCKKSGIINYLGSVQQCGCEVTNTKCEKDSSTAPEPSPTPEATPAACPYKH